MECYEGDWVKVHGKPYQIERLLETFDKKEGFQITGFITKGLALPVLVEDVEEYLPDYKILLHRNSYYKELLLRTEEFLDGLDLYNTNLFNDISKVLEEWE